MHLDRDVVAGGDFLARGLQVGLGAGDQDDVDTFGGEAFGAGEADAFGGAGDQRGPAAQVQVHGVLPGGWLVGEWVVWRGELRKPHGDRANRVATRRSESQIVQLQQCQSLAIAKFEVVTLVSLDLAER